MADENDFDVNKWKTDPKFQKSREQFNACVDAAIEARSAKTEEERKKKAAEDQAKLPWPFNLFSG